MSHKRKPKQGYVYLLKNVSESDSRVYKFGCTTITPEKRCAKVNSERADSGYKFKVIASFKSFDIYADECKVKHKILNAGMGMISEIFTSDVDDGLNSDGDVIKRFLLIGGVIEKGVLI